MQSGPRRERNRDCDCEVSKFYKSKNLAKHAQMHRTVKSFADLSRCSHFSKLPPGEAGTIKFEHDGEHGGAFEFTLGRDRFFLGQLLATH